MSPFKTFEVRLNSLWIDDELVMMRPEYIPVSQWLDYWDAVQQNFGFNAEYDKGYDAGYSDGYAMGVSQ